jgi:predicted DNA-binding transcriptional regulator AlpA
MPIEIDGDKELTTSEFAALIKASKTTCDIWRQQGKGPVYKKYPNRAVRYRMSDIQAWMDAVPTRRSTSAQIVYPRQPAQA